MTRLAGRLACGYRAAAFAVSSFGQTLHQPQQVGEALLHPAERDGVGHAHVILPGVRTDGAGSVEPGDLASFRD